MRAVKAAQNSESKRMFESDLFEFFSRIPWWQPLVIYVPLIAWVSFTAFEVGTSLLHFAGLFFAGVIHWTLMEYWLHRVAFHYPAKSKIGKKLVWFSHGVHHDWPNDKMRLVFPPAVSLPLAALFFAFYTATFGDVYRWGIFSGLLVGYLAYDMIHYITHHYVPNDPILKYLRKYHMEHHFKHEPLRYDVSNPLWDYVFGTAPKAKK